jgi:hypothetical protein
MATALPEPIDVSTMTHIHTSAARSDASRANGRHSRGPTSPEGKARSRRNGCKDGLTGTGIVLPPAAAEEVRRREAEFAREFRPRGAVERELVRQMALASWRGRELAVRIERHDARVNVEKFAHWEQDQQIAAAEVGRRLADDPETVVAQLERSSAGCDWLIGRWTLLASALADANVGGPDCTWTGADVSLALDLLARPVELRHLDDGVRRLESLRAQAHSGSNEAVAELRAHIAHEVAELKQCREEARERVEEPLLEDWRAGLEIDLGPEGTRLRRYEAAADRLFRSAWTKLERLRQERGEPLIYRTARDYSRADLGDDQESISSATGRVSVPPPVPAKAPAPSPSPPRPMPAPVSPMPVGPAITLPDPQAATVLDLWITGRPSLDKTNPAPGRLAEGAIPARRSSPPDATLKNRL